MSSLIPLSGEGILLEHVQRRNTHFCSVFFHCFRCVKQPRKSAEIIKTAGVVRSSPCVVLSPGSCPAVRSAWLRPRWLLSSKESPQPAGVMRGLPPPHPPPPPPAYRAVRRPMRHSRLAPLTHASQNFSTQRLGGPGSSDRRNKYLNIAKGGKKERNGRDAATLFGKRKGKREKAR